MDCVYLGTEQAENVLVITSGTHGVELLPGSACQFALLDSGALDPKRLPENIAVVLIHGINPWGAAYRRRNTEDNVDLCRNFVDFEQDLPVNSAYADVHDTIHALELDQVRDFVERSVGQNNTASFMNAIMGGQYICSDGFSYGGEKACWSHSVLAEYLPTLQNGRKRIDFLDLHSGVGPYAYGSIVAVQRHGALKRAKQAYGGWLIAPREFAESKPDEFYDVTGHSADGYERILSGSDTCAVVLEFGTYPVTEVFTALLTDHLLYAAGSINTELISETRDKLEELHCPANDCWREAIVQRCFQAFDQACTGLLAS